MISAIRFYLYVIKLSVFQVMSLICVLFNHLSSVSLEVFPLHRDVLPLADVVISKSCCQIDEEKICYLWLYVLTALEKKHLLISSSFPAVVNNLLPLLMSDAVITQISFSYAQWYPPPTHAFISIPILISHSFGSSCKYSPCVLISFLA